MLPQTVSPEKCHSKACMMEAIHLRSAPMDLSALAISGPLVKKLPSVFSFSFITAHNSISSSFYDISLP